MLPPDARAAVRKPEKQRSVEEQKLVDDYTVPLRVDPIKVKGQILQLKRIISVVAAHSFTVTEDLSENGGPFVRLGSAVYTKAAAAK